jgi:hypothetical protein
MGIYRARKQHTSGPRGVRSRTINQRSKGCFIRPGIIQQLIKKVVYIWYIRVYVYILFTEYDILFVSICPVVHQRTSTIKDKSVRLPILVYVRTKKQEHMSGGPLAYVHTTDKSVRLVQKSNFFKMPFWLILVTQSPN